jgi:transketolase
MTNPAKLSPAPIKTVDNLQLRPLANCIRTLAMDAVEAANSGHPGMPMGMADVAAVLFAKHLKFDAAHPHWPNRDRFILSGGHGSMLLYAVSYLTGYASMTIEQIKNFRQLHSRTPGHPEIDVECGIEMTTGPLGQGIATSVGFALAERVMNARYPDIMNHKTYVFAGDGDMQEGVNHEACALAGHLRLNNLIVLYDDNNITIDGPTSLSFTEDVEKRFEAYGWVTKKIDGLDASAVDAALTWAKTQDKPVLIACKTIIGFGAPNKAGTADCHGSPLGAEEIVKAKAALGWTAPAFEVPADLLNQWRDIGAQHRDVYEAWEKQLAALPEATRVQFIEQMNGVTGAALTNAIKSIKEKFIADPTAIATRKASQLVLDEIVPALPHLMGGSADLTGSNLTKVKGPVVVNADHYNGQYIYYGVREHGMVAAMNGLSLHGGLIPYGGTFLSFTDYCRPAIRLAAIMKCRNIMVMTHDSIGLGEDGPTHQPVEHLAALRSMPNVLVLRPCDAVETAEAWEIALTHKTGPSILCLTRQNVKLQRCDNDENKSRRGGYILQEASSEPKVVIMATGSEIEIAVEARGKLEAMGTSTRVVSLPSFELFRAQDDAYRANVLGPKTAIKVGVEAAMRQGWDAWIGSDGIFIGMNSFGESAPAKKLYAHFGITADNVVAQVQRKLG